MSGLAAAWGRRKCPSCHELLLELADLVDRARASVARAATAERAAQEAALRQATVDLARGLRCHLGRCTVSRLSIESLREGHRLCDRCGFGVASVATLERRSARLLRTLAGAEVAGGLAVLMLDVSLTQTLRALDCRLGRCSGGAR